MVKTVEETFVASDGAKFFSKIWRPDEAVKAHVVFLHGFNDHCEIQYDLFPILASAPFNIQSHSFDQRGWGKSALESHQKGNSGPTTQILQDLHEYLQHVASSIPDINQTPLFLMGHSMGGQVSLHYLLGQHDDNKYAKDRPKLSGFIITSPWVGLDPASEPNWATVFIGKIVAKIMPTYQLKQQLDHRFITRDPAKNQYWKDDPLCHEYIGLKPAEQMLQRAADLQTLSSASKPVPKLLTEQLPVPTLWMHGTEDKVCAYAPSKELCDRLAGPPADVVPAGIEGKSFRTYEGAYHKLHAEPDGLDKQHIKDIAEWILQIVDAQRNDSDTTPERAKL